MKKIFLFLFILTTIMSARAQQGGSANLDGYVYMLDSVNIIEGAIVKATNGDNVYIDTTGTDGHYTFDSIKAYGIPVNYYLTTEATGFFNDTTIVTVSNGDQITQNVYLTKAGSIEGNVTLNDESGVYGDVSDALLCLIFNNDTIQTTNPDSITGHYIFDQLQIGEYSVNVSLDNFITQDSIIEIDSTETYTCNFSLNLIPGSIKGQVSMEEMQLVNSVKVTLNDEYTVYPDTLTGLYEFENIIPGIYTIKASLENYSSNPVSYPDENLMPGDSIIDKNFTMQKDLAKVFGYVTNTNGEFISNVSVSAGVESSTTNEQGYYEIDSLPVGEISITVSAQGYFDNTEDTLLVSEENQVDFTLIHKPRVYAEDVPDEGIVFDAIPTDSTSVSKMFSVHGRYLNSDIVTLSAEPFEISLDRINEYSYDIQIPLETGKSNIDTNIFIRFTPTEAGKDSTQVLITSNDAENDTVLVKGEGKLFVEIESSIDTICIGDSIRLMASVKGGNENAYNYKWLKNNIQFSTDSIVYVAPIEETEYTLTVTDAITGNSNSDQISIQVYKPITIMDNPADISVCAGEDVYFEVSLNIDKGVTYQWQVNGSDIEDDSIYSGTNSDKLMVKTNYSLNQNIFQCKITTQCKDILSDSAVLTVHRLPIDTLIIKGSPPVLLISPDSGQIYQWYKNGVSLLGENGQYYYPTGGFDGGSEYYLVIKTEFSCIDTTNSYIAPANKSISVYLNPVSNILFIDATSLQSKSELTVFISDLSGRQLIRKSICHNNRKMNLSVNRLIQGVYLIAIVDDTGLNLYSSKIIK